MSRGFVKPLAGPVVEDGSCGFSQKANSAGSSGSRLEWVANLAFWFTPS